MEVSVGSGGMGDQDPWVNAPLRMGHPKVLDVGEELTKSGCNKWWSQYYCSLGVMEVITVIIAPSRNYSLGQCKS